MSFLYKVDKVLRDMKVLKFVFTMVLLTYLISFALVPLFLLFDIPDMGGFSMDESNIELEFYLVVVIAPIIETFLFQTLFFWILLKIKFFQKNVILIIILSAAAFGIFHGYSSVYIIYAFLGGLLFAYSYYVYINKDYSSFWVVTSIHSIRNLIVFIYSIILMN